MHVYPIVFLAALDEYDELIKVLLKTVAVKNLHTRTVKQNR